jgi:hypothetical protein
MKLGGKNVPMSITQKNS